MDYLVMLLMFVWLVGFMSIAYHMTHRFHDVRMQLMDSQTIIREAQQRIADMGVQLLNLKWSMSNAHPGYVYVLQSISGHYKIGRTVNPTDRARTFGVKLPMEVEYIILIHTGDCHHLERLLHQQYRHKQVNGEWFQLEDNDLLFLRAFPGAVEPIQG